MAKMAFSWSEILFVSSLPHAGHMGGEGATLRGVHISAFNLFGVCVGG